MAVPALVASSEGGTAWQRRWRRGGRHGDGRGGAGAGREGGQSRADKFAGDAPPTRLLWLGVVLPLRSHMDWLALGDPPATACDAAKPAVALTNGAKPPSRSPI